MQGGWEYEQNIWHNLLVENSVNTFHYENLELQWGVPKMDKVLVIEDEPSIAILLASIIEDYGYEVTTVFDGKRGYELARTGVYKLVITDNMLPGMVGREICLRLHQEPAAQHTIVILMSAVSNLTEISCNATAFLAKPFDISTIDQLVQRYLTTPLSQKLQPDDDAAYPVEDYDFTVQHLNHN